jgi:RES domain-containing protein
MIVYRITNTAYKDDLSGTGAKTYGGRWNHPGVAGLYTASHISLSVLEMLVNITLPESQLKYHVLHINIPANIDTAVITAKKLKKNWEDDEDYTRFMGTAFLKDKQSLLLQVPSAVIAEENNYIINPLHSDFKKISIVKSYAFKFDKRLFTF